MSQVDGKTYRALRDLTEELYEALKDIDIALVEANIAAPLVDAALARYEKEMKP